MRDASPQHPAKPSTLSRRTLLGVAAAALLGSYFPVRGVGAIGGRWAVEVDAPHPNLAAQSSDPLSSWNDGPRKQAILDFVAAATNEGTTDFVPVADRIATFDM